MSDAAPEVWRGDRARWNAPAQLHTINKAIVEAFRGYFDAHPDVRARDRYYRDKVERGAMFNAIQIVQYNYVLEKYPRSTRVVELGAGAGQFPLALGATGYRAVGVEMDDMRVAEMEHLRVCLNQEFPGTARNVSIETTPFPETVPDGDVLVLANAVNRYTAKHENEILRTFHEYLEVVMDVALFGATRRSEFCQSELIDRIRSEGFEYETLKLDPETFQYHLVALTRIPG